MQIHHLRNATLVLRLAGQRLLVDPMLGDQGTAMPFRMFRGTRRRNPTVPMPPGAKAALDDITGAVITHRHPDHLDATAFGFLRARKLPVYAHPRDLRQLRRKGLDARDFEAEAAAIGLEVKAIPTLHGYGLVGRLVGKGTGWYIRPKGKEDGVYITGDTVLIEPVRSAIREHRPKVIVAPAGVANFGVLQDLLFPEEELLELAEIAPGCVLYNHQEALDHCLYTRAQLREALEAKGLLNKAAIPEDGELLEFP